MFTLMLAKGRRQDLNHSWVILLHVLYKFIPTGLPGDTLLYLCHDTMHFFYLLS